MWQLTFITFKRGQRCTWRILAKERDVVAWLHCQTYKFWLISHLWSWWKMFRWHQDHLQPRQCKEVPGTDQSVTELPADDSTLEGMPTDLSRLCRCHKYCCSPYPACCSVSGYDIADICLLTQCTNMCDDDDDHECSKCLNNYGNVSSVSVYHVHLYTCVKCRWELVL